MKKMVPLITLILAISMLPYSTLLAQQATTGEKEKQKEAEIQQKKAEEMQKKTEMLKQAQIEAEMKKKENANFEYEVIRKKAEGMADKRIRVISDENSWNLRVVPDVGNYFYFGNYGIGEKSGSSWNYSRQVLESTFSNEFTMDASGDHGSATLSVSGNCAEGSIAVAIIMPDG
ncbi:MAG TPA: hypothetical protein VMV74_01135, partial [Bacteroidales bacterium]|nr:hypothetical protein [Bacteroidales bacterium]